MPEGNGKIDGLRQGRPAALDDMKVIVVSGARSHVGKTHLARALCKLLPGAVRIKIGHQEHKNKEGEDDYLYPMGTPFPRIAADHADAAFLVIESNSVLEEITPDCAIYLPADDAKPSAAIARRKADIIRGEGVPASEVALLAGRLGCDASVVEKIVKLSGASVG
jgi:hypothetical protein